MSRPSFPSDIAVQAQAVLAAWKTIDPAFKAGEVTLESLEAAAAEVASILNQISSLDAQLTDLRNQRDSRSLAVWQMVKRVRDGIKGSYGDDSSQYEMIGGKRMSERKRPARKKTP